MRRKQDWNKSNHINGILFEPGSDWTSPSEFPNLSGVKRIGLDIETKDPELTTRGPGFIRGDADVVGIAMATDDCSWYFPFGHLGGGNLDRDIVCNYFRDILGDRDLNVVTANGIYELEGLWSLGIDVSGKLADIQIIEPLLDEEREIGYRLDDLCGLYLSTRKDEALLSAAAKEYGIHEKHSLWKLPAKYVGTYAEYDAFSTLKIFDKQMERVRKEGLEEILTLELQLLPILWEMRRQGIPIDLEAATILQKDLGIEEENLKIKIKKDYGRNVDVWSGPDIAKMCESLQIKFPSTERGNPSFVSKWLDEHDHPFIELVAEQRQISKLKDTFVKNWIFKNQIKGRIHPQWKQLMSDEGGTRTGRMAASNPNPQQVPAGKKRDGTARPIGAKIRGLFRSDTGMWFKGDYSQQEPRILTHFAAVCNYAGAEAAAMSYRTNPKMDFYKFMEELANINRRTAKDMYLGRCYGMGKNKLATKLNKSVEECEKILQDFDAKVPFVKEIADKCMQLAQTRGYVKTLCGRRRHFNYWEPRDAYQMRKADRFADVRPMLLKDAQAKWSTKTLVRSGTHKALNAVIQGSAADMMKSAIVLGYHEQGRIPYITVHDELGGPVTDEKDAAEWQHIMEHCVTMNVPVLVEVKLGESWS